MGFSVVDVAIILGYLVLSSLVGFVLKRAATKSTDSFFLGDRKVRWWMLGLAGCSSYIDIGGTMAMVSALFYLGLKSVWMTHIFWGMFIIAFFMAFQAKWIRRSGVRTFAEWNKTRFGDNRDAEKARLVSAIFVSVLMIFNFTIIAVGTGKFVSEFLPFAPWLSTLIVFASVGVYVTLGGFYGVVLTDMLQTILIAIGAVILGAMVFSNGGVAGSIALKDPGWSSLAPSWTLWSGYLKDTTASYQHFYYFGPILLAGFTWMVFRILAGPNVWDFQFFLTVRSPRDASLSAGMWTVGYVIRWIIACAFMFFGVFYLKAGQQFDGERVLPLVLNKLPVGMKGVFIAVMLAALMSSISAMANMLSSVFINDFVRRYIAKDKTETQLVRIGQMASVAALFLGFAMSLSFTSVIAIWETTIFVVVTTILLPATMRWHWWRFSARAFVWSMLVSAVIITAQKVFFGGWPVTTALPAVTLACLVATVVIGLLNKPTDMETLVAFYSRVRPFGFWGPVRREAVREGLVPKRDVMPTMDALNGLLCSVLQFSLALIPFYFFLRKWAGFGMWIAVLAAVGVVLYFTWYKTLPAEDEV